MPPTRSTRQSSRRSSPYGVTTRNSPAPPVKAPARDKENDKSSQQQHRPLRADEAWEEPTPQPLKPTFMEHGMERTPLFMNMQALGTMPSARLKAQVRERPGRHGAAVKERFYNEAAEVARREAAYDERASRSSEARGSEDTASQPAAQEPVRLHLKRGAQDEAEPPQRVQRLKITNNNGSTPSRTLRNTPTLPPASAYDGGDQSEASTRPPSFVFSDTPSPDEIILEDPTHVWNAEYRDSLVAPITKRCEENGRGRHNEITKLAVLEVLRLSEHDEKLEEAIIAMANGISMRGQERRYNNYIKRSKIRLRRMLEKGRLNLPNTSTASGAADDVAGSSTTPSATPGQAPAVAPTLAVTTDPTPAEGSAPVSTQPTTPNVAEQSSGSLSAPNGLLPGGDGVNSPAKQSSIGDLSEVDEKLIRRVENERLAVSEDDRRKKRKASEKASGKARASKRVKKDEANDEDEKDRRIDEETVAWKKRHREERTSTFPAGFTEIYERTPLTPPKGFDDSPPAASTRSRRQQPQQPTVQVNGSQKRNDDRAEDSASPLSEELGSSAFDSDVDLPPPGPPSKGQKTAAKTKISPVKNRSAAVVGVSRLGGGRGTPTANDDTARTSDDEHQDTCTGCGGEGFLVCCDGCDAAYHLQCADPPLSEDSAELKTAWYCPRCKRAPLKERESSPRVPDGIWGEMSSVVHNLQGKNFQLPSSIQTYFEDNSVGPDGDYATGEVTFHRVSHARDGPDEHPSYTLLHDKKEKPIICSQCFQSVAFEDTKRPIIQCDKPTCLAYWHLDCLDPPLANPPTRGVQKGYRKTKLQWLCPRHVEHDHRNLHNPAFRARHEALGPPVFDRALHRTRIPRHPRYVPYHRGMRTYGRIDVVNHSEDDTPFFEEEELGGTVVRMPEDAIKVNFIEKIKSERMFAEQQGLLSRRKPSHLDIAFQRRSFDDQRAALSLAQLAERQNEVDVNADGVAKLVYALTAQAEGDVEGGDVAPSFNLDLNDAKQREELIRIRGLIDSALAPGSHSFNGTVGLTNGVSKAPIAMNSLHTPRIPRTRPLNTPTIKTEPVAKRQYLDIAAGDTIEVRSESGLEPPTLLNGSIDDREAQSAPGSPRRETRRATRRSAIGSHK